MPNKRAWWLKYVCYVCGSSWALVFVLVCLGLRVFFLPFRCARPHHAPGTTRVQVGAHEARKKLAKEEERGQKLNAERNAALESLKAKAEAKVAIEKRHAALASEVKSVRSEQVRSKKEFTAFERKDIKFRADLKHEKAHIKKLTATVARETKKATAASEAIVSAEAALPSLLEEVEAAEASKETEDAKVDEILESVKVRGIRLTHGTGIFYSTPLHSISLESVLIRVVACLLAVFVCFVVQEKAGEYRQALEAKQRELEPFSAKLNEAKGELDTTTTQHQLLKDKVEATAKELAKVIKEKADVKQQLSAKSLQLRNLSHEFGDKEERMAQVTTDADNMKRKLQAFTEKVKELRSTAAEGKMALQQQSNRSRLVSALNTAARPGGKLANSGLCGRLGDLGTIDPAYDVAISTACGALNNLVVDTVRGAQMCVKFLRENQLGVATFIILEKLQHLIPHMQRKVTTPPGTERLFDLIKISKPKCVVCLLPVVARVAQCCVQSRC